MRAIWIVCWALGLNLWIGVASAQQAAVSLRTLQLGKGEMPESWVRVKDEKEPVKLSWLTSQPTEPLFALHDGQLKLFKYGVNAEGKVEVSNIRAIPLPVGAKEILLLVWPDEGNGKYVAIEDLFLNAKFDDWMAINTSSKQVALKAGEGKPVRIDPGKSIIFKPKIEENKGVEMVAMAPHKGELKKFLSSYWPAFPGQRTMIVIYDDGEKLRAKRIGDRFLRKKEQPPAGPGEP